MRPISTLDLLGLQCQMTPPLSGKIRYSTVTPCDGHGLVVGINLDHTELLEKCLIYLCFSLFFLCGVDTPRVVICSFYQNE